jgi:hypothetical protein
MPSKEKPIPPSEWRVIVENVPLVSVDLVVEHDGGVLLGKRENEPAQGEWFVPGGTVLRLSGTLLTKHLPNLIPVRRVPRPSIGAKPGKTEQSSVVSPEYKMDYPLSTPYF